ncbi:MAG: 30S ribosomal protein S1 [Deltaproteobacteria bacterium]|nr:30S ribosomal protein S1 [Deltaproteobacteria bacterium]
MNVTTQDFEKLFEASVQHKAMKPGELIKGNVVKVLRDYVLVDVGFKSEGQISIEEFRNLDGEITVKAGDVVDVVFENVEDENGLVVLSKEKADALAAWDKLSEAETSNETVDGVIINKIKGGMVVNVGGVRAFLPGSQIDLKPVKSLDKLVGKKFRFKILKLNRSKGNVVVSRRAVLEVELEEAKNELLSTLQEGQVVEGIVKNITDYGAFVDLGGVDGLIHITDISWGRIGHPSEVLKVGDKINVLILRYDDESKKISLGLKQLSQDPWEQVKDGYLPGTKVKGKVVNITDYGAFIELESGVEGLVHVSEMSWTKKVKHPSKIVNLGDSVEAVVLDVDAPSRRISLGMKQIEPNPWDELEAKYPSGTKINGEIKNITDFGLFVGVEDGIDGLVHVSDISWTKKIKHPSDLYKKGDHVDAVVLNVDKKNERFSLGIKQLEEDPFAQACNGCPVGKVVEGKVTAVDSSGATIDFGMGIDGYISSKHFDREPPKVDDQIDAEVSGHDDKERRIILSIRQYIKNAQKRDFEDFKAKQGESRATLFDVMKKE